MYSAAARSGCQRSCLRAGATGLAFHGCESDLHVGRRSTLPPSPPGRRAQTWRLGLSLPSMTEGSYVRAQPRRIALQKPGTGLASTAEPWHGAQATLSSLSPRVAAGRRTSVASTAMAASCRRSTAPAVSSSSGACRAASARQARTRSRPLSSRSPWRGAWGGAELGASRSTPRCGTGLGASGNTATGAASRARGVVLNSSRFAVPHEGHSF